MRFNTPITSSQKVDDRSKTFTIYSLTGSPSGASGVVSAGLKPSSHDMKDTKTVQIKNPQFRTHNVKATDNFSAPVAKLQAWLASDPTKPKKDFLTIRKGNNIIAKSNKFEKQTMAVGTKSQQLQDIAEKNVVTNNRKQFEPKVEENKEDKTSTKDNTLYDAVVADESKQALEPFDVEVEEGDPIGQSQSGEFSLSFLEESITDDDLRVNKKDEDNIVEKHEEKKTFSEALAEFQLDEDVPKLLGTVELRKQKLEAMEREARRQANNKYGMLKPSWGRPHPSHGMPSDAWNRSLKGTPPPKKTFADLP